MTQEQDRSRARRRRGKRTKREYVVTIPDAEVSRLRAFDSKANGNKHWPLGPNRTFWRKNPSTFVVKGYAGSAVGGAFVTTLGTATLQEGSDQVLVNVTKKAHGFGYLLIGGGVLVALLTSGDGITTLLLGALLAVAGWSLFVNRRGQEGHLDEVEQVLRAEIRGDWRPVGEETDAAYAGPPRTALQTANRLTSFLHGDEVDSRPAIATGWSVANLLPARASLAGGLLRSRRRGRLAATIPMHTISFFAQISWTRGRVDEYPSIEMWVVDNDGQPLAVVSWDTRLERQVRDAGLLVRSFAHDIDREVVLHVWAGRPTHPVAEYVDPIVRT